MSGPLAAGAATTISRDTLDRASRAKETIEAYYADLVRLKTERNERLRKINGLINQELLSEEEKLQESWLIKLSTVYFPLYNINSKYLPDICMTFCVTFSVSEHFVVKVLCQQFATETTTLCRQRVGVSSDETMQALGEGFHSAKSDRERCIRRGAAGPEGGHGARVRHEGAA